jgi:hypothetical protein
MAAVGGNVAGDDWHDFGLVAAGWWQRHLPLSTHQAVASALLFRRKDLTTVTGGLLMVLARTSDMAIPPLQILDL